MADQELPSALVTDDEWAAIDAIRRGSDVAAAAASAGVDEPASRRTLSTAGEKLRMMSAIRSAAPTSDRGFEVPRMDPCPYCESVAGRFLTRSGPPAVIHEDDEV